MRISGGEWVVSSSPFGSIEKGIMAFVFKIEKSVKNASGSNSESCSYAGRHCDFWMVSFKLFSGRKEVNSEIQGSRIPIRKKEWRLEMASMEEVLERLKAKARSDRVEGMARYGMLADRRLGVSVPEMRAIAEELGKDHGLACELWETGIAEAKIVAVMIAEPEKLTEKQMEDWVRDIDSWDVCDQVCMNLFEKTPLARKKILNWSHLGSSARPRSHSQLLLQPPSSPDS